MDSDHFLVIGKSTGEVIYHKCCLMVAFCRKNCLTQGGNMDEQEKKYQDLFTELTNYERCPDADEWLSGKSASDRVSAYGKRRK